MAKKKATSNRNTTIEPEVLSEETVFYPDKKKTNPAKNRLLATYAETLMLRKPIVSVKRIEIGSEQGWLFTYRT